LQQAQLDGAAIDAMRAFAAEALPLAEAVASLKDKVVKGRAPSTGPAKPVNPNKIVKTCPCCFRQIAVTNGTMAHHGYQRPGYGWQTASCPGIRFKPLEISNEGLLWMIETTKTSIAKDRAALADSDKLESITPLRGKTVRVGETGYARQLAIYIAGLESTIRQAEGWLSILEKRLAEWRPSE
jgi:hypothetical protein